MLDSTKNSCLFLLFSLFAQAKIQFLESKLKNINNAIQKVIGDARITQISFQDVR